MLRLSRMVAEEKADEGRKERNIKKLFVIRLITTV
jgi:hypothetical protein